MAYYLVRMIVTVTAARAV